MRRPPRWLVKISIVLGALPLLFNLGIRGQMALGLYPPFPKSIGLLGLELVLLKFIDPFFLLGIGTPIAGRSIWPWILFTPVKILFWLTILWWVHRVEHSSLAQRGDHEPAL